jgi:hypothetical protein
MTIFCGLVPRHPWCFACARDNQDLLNMKAVRPFGGIFIYPSVLYSLVPGAFFHLPRPCAWQFQAMISQHRYPRTMYSQDLTPASPARCQVTIMVPFAVVLVLPLLSHHNPPRSFCLFKYSLGTNKCRTPTQGTETRIALVASSSVLRRIIEWEGPKNWTLESGWCELPWARRLTYGTPVHDVIVFVWWKICGTVWRWHLHVVRLG